ncbi:hypothetical protein [Lactobacillus helveticus]|uniref:hypothetical protein n=1 Tax=Lactobacillus helveticus TaxID=1587 RepID=UPI003863B731
MKKIGIGLLMLAGAVAMLMAIPKQVSAASNGRSVSEQYATAVVDEYNVSLGKYVVDSSTTDPYVNLIGFDSEPLWQAYKNSMRKHHRKHHDN